MPDGHKYVEIEQRGDRKVIDIKFKNNAPSALDREIDIKIRPRYLIFGTIIVLIALLIFFAGRWSTDDYEITLPKFNLSETFSGLSSPFKKNVSETKIEETLEKTTPPAITEESVPEPSLEVESSSENTSTSENNITTTPPIVEQPPANITSNENETIISQYSKVSLTVTNVNFDWKETWGKITQISYTIKNLETGPILVSYITMTVEGYDDSPKKMTLPPSLHKIDAGTQISGGLNVPQGLAYSEVSAGDLSDVEITFALYDEKDVAVASFKKGFNIKGSSS